MQKQTVKILAALCLVSVIVYAVTQEPTETKIVPADGVPQDYFGDSVALDGDTLAVGSSSSRSSAGSVYVYSHTASGWVAQQKIFQNQTEGFFFGTSVALSGNTLAVGCPYNYSGSDALGGAVFIYVRDVNGWQLQQVVTSPAAFDGDGFGMSVTLLGETLVVGAPPDMGWMSPGAAFIFVRDSGAWSLRQTLVGSDSLPGSGFGTSVGITPGTVAVGRMGDGSGPGAVYVFTQSSSVWAQTQKLTASDAGVDDDFGKAVGLSGDTLLVGAPHNSTRGDQFGSAYIFTLSGGVWSETQRLEDATGEAFDQFGSAVALTASKVVVGSISGNGINADSGSANAYHKENGTWVLDRKLMASDGRSQDVFGHSVAVSRSRMAIGALKYFNFKPGAVYVYEDASDTTPPVVDCPAAQTVSADANGKASIPDFASAATASDDRTSVANLVRTQNPAAGTLVGLGSHSVTVQVADEAGNVASCTTSLTVVDTTPPSVSLPQQFSAASDDHCQAVVPDVIARGIFSDNCTASDGLVKVQEPAAGTVVNSGSTPIKVTATDAAGNKGSASTVFVVVDRTAPTVVAPQAVTVAADDHGHAVVPDFVSGLVASDNCTASASLVKVQQPAAGTVVGAGVTTISIVVSDAAGNSAPVSTSLTVVDRTAPSVVAPDSLTVAADSNGGAVVPDVVSQVVASDNVTPSDALVKSQDPVAGTPLGGGTTLVRVTVTDQAGNSTVTVTKLMVKDVTAPQINSLSVSPSVITKVNGKMVPVTVMISVTDNCDPAPRAKILCITDDQPAGARDRSEIDSEITGDLTANVRAEENPRGTPRTYTLTVQACDASGNKSTATVFVTVSKDGLTSIVANVRKGKEKH